MADSSKARFERLLRMDAALREGLQEEAPDAEVGVQIHADFNELARRVCERCELECDAIVQDQLRALWSSYERDADGLRSDESSLRLRFRGRGQYRVTPLRPLHELGETRGRFLVAAGVVFRRVLRALDANQRGKSLLWLLTAKRLSLRWRQTWKLLPT